MTTLTFGRPISAADLAGFHGGAQCVITITSMGHVIMEGHCSGVEIKSEG
ncbi:hypothetical protein [Kocuria coralli]|nr:hypothetical protein [Kocuria coralli]